MLEILGEQISRKLRRIPDNKTGSVDVPGDDVIDGAVVDDLVSFGQKRRRNEPRHIFSRRFSASPVHRRRSHKRARLAALIQHRKNHAETHPAQKERENNHNHSPALIVQSKTSIYERERE